MSQTREEQDDLIRRSVRDVCKRYPTEYWRRLDEERRYPEEFVNELQRLGWLSMLIRKEYGGGGATIRDASIVLEEIDRSGGNASACHAQMYTMAVISRHGTEEQRKKFLTKIASGETRLQSFAITEPDAGSDSTKINTFAKKRDGRYVVNGQKIFTSRLQHSDLMLLVARTSPYEPESKTDGISLFIVDLAKSSSSIRVNPIKTMINHETNSLFIDNLVIDEESRIGEEGRGFRLLMDVLNAERILIAGECIGDAEWFIEKSVKYAKERNVFGRPIGANQGVQFPLASVYAKVRAASQMRFLAAELFDSMKSCAEETNIAKLLASEASWEAANVAMNVFGGYGMAVDFDVERKFRENRLYLVAPVSNNLILSYIGDHVLGLPRSY
jgi:acyl-CoA dehydrogenase